MELLYLRDSLKDRLVVFVGSALVSDPPALAKPGAPAFATLEVFLGDAMVLQNYLSKPGF
jgi:hypothetical protein